MANEELDDWVREFWRRVAWRCPEFDIVLPDTASFVCQASSCPAHCCKVFTVVPLGEREVVQLSQASGLHPLEAIECDEGAPLTHRSLPAARPYFLARRDGVCRFLGADLLCSQHAGRPDACRVYPYYVFFFDTLAAEPVKDGWRDMATTVEWLSRGETPVAERALAPLLLRHRDCPGSTGPAIGRRAWLALVGETFRLQYGEPPSPPASP